MKNAATGDARWLLFGVIFTAAGAMLFAAKGLFAKQLYALGVTFEAVVVIRAAIALPLFFAFAAHREGTGKIFSTPRNAIGMAALAGFLCYYVGAMTDFYALTLIDASIERVLLFSYPAIIVLFKSVRGRTLPSRRVVLATLVTYVGIFFTMGGFDLHELRANVFGACMVLVSALTYAIYYLIGERYTHAMGSSRYTLFAMGGATVALLLHSLLFLQPTRFTSIPAAGWILLGGISTVCMFFPALLQAEGMRRIGAQRGSVVSTVGPPTAVLLAWALLGERLTAWQLLGIALIVGAVLALEIRRS